MKKTLALSLLLAGMAQAGITQVAPYSITVGGQVYTDSDTQNIKLLTNDASNGLSSAYDPAAAYTILAVKDGSDKGRYELSNINTDLTNQGTIVIASGSYKASSDGENAEFAAGQLFITGGGTISNNMIIGESAYVDQYAGEAHGDNYCGAIRFHNGNQNTKLVLSGNITLVDDAVMSVGGQVVGDANAYIEGVISGEGKTLRLTQGGKLAFSGGATLQTLDGNANVLLDDKKSDGSTQATGATYTFANAIGSTRTLTVEGGVTLTLLGGDEDSETLQTTSMKLAGAGNLNIGTAQTSNTVILTTAGSMGKVDIKGENTLMVNCNGAFTAHFDLNGSGQAYSGKLIVGSNARVTANQNLWFNKNCGIDILAGGQLTRGEIVVNTQKDATATVRHTGNGGVNFGLGDGGIKMTNVDLALTISNANATTINATLENASLTNNGNLLLTDKQSANTKYVAVTAAEAGFDFAGKANGLEIGTLTLGESQSVGVYANEAKTTQAGLLVTGRLESAENTSITTSMLTLADGVTLDFGSSVTLAGALTMNSNLVLEDGMLGEDGVTLFTGVTGLTLATGVYTAPVDAATVFTGVETGTYNLVFSGNVVSLQAAAVPEPATATLSLLALAGLCARRRRK